MSGRNNLTELLEVLEGIRKEKYPDIPADLIRRIAIVQYDNQDKRLIASDETNKIVNEFLNKVVLQEN